MHVRALEGVDGVLAPASTDAALDHRAVTQYRQRLRDLDEELDEAERHADSARAEQVAGERDALIEQLTTAFGLAGRPRTSGSDPDERLRKAVSARVKATIDRVEALHPVLGRHLRCSVRTGYWCSYEPEHPVEWTVVGHRHR
ncbi:MAG: hypothetical protein KY450_13870 [Actinobacteria bacterium]|nr:hypothetical protein [Actinomycetota bacterium]